MTELPLIARAIAHADRVAIESGGQCYTYKDLMEGSAAVASALLETADDLAEARIGFLIPPGFDYVRAQWGIWRAGGMAVPLSLSATQQETAYTLAALEIEAALLDHPAISECAVIGIPDDTRGEIVATVIVLHGEARLSLDELRAWCTDRISHYKLPRRVLSVKQLPRNAMGKVTKPAIRNLFASESPD